MYRQALALSVGLTLCAPTALPQASSSALTANQLVEAALSTNREFLSLRQRITEAKGLVKQAGVKPADNLDVSGLAGQAFGNKGEDALNLTYSHTFETFGKRGKRVAVAEKEMALAQAELDKRRIALSFEVKTRYGDAVIEQRKLAVIDRLLGINRDYLRLTEARVGTGDAAPLEADLLRVELNRDEAQRMLTDGRLRAAVLQLKATLDIAATSPLPIAANLTPPTFDDNLQHLKTRALTSRPDARALRITEDQTGTQSALAKVETKPNLTLLGQYSHADNAFDQYGLTAAGALTPIRDHIDYLGIGVSIPLTTSHRNRGNIEAAVARQTGAKLRREYLEAVISTQVEAAYEHWRAAREATTVFSQGVLAQSEKNLAVMRQAYTLGELRLIDILNEQRRLLDTVLGYIDAQGDLFRAYAELEQATGGFL